MERATPEKGLPPPGPRDAAEAPFTIWSERPIPPDLRVLLGSARSIGAWNHPEADPFRSVETADAIIASSRLRYDAMVIKRARRLRVIARTGIGVDNVDIDAASRRAIPVCNVPEGPTTSTAEHAIALLLAVTKRLKVCDRIILSGRWDIFNEHDAIELEGAPLGVVGVGKIGRRVAAAAVALGMNVRAWDPNLDRATIERTGASAAGSLDELVEASLVVSIHAPLTDATRGLIDRRRISLMPRGGVIINTARGGLLDEAALLEALDSGHLSGAGLDVFEQEPLDSASPLLGRDDVVVTPHVAAATVAGRDRLWRSAIDETLRCLHGQKPRHAVNAADLWRT